MSESDAIIADYANGLNVIGCARKYRHSGTTISAILREAGVLGELAKQEAIRKSRVYRESAQFSPGIMTKPTREEWAFIAGIFEGEGSLTFEASYLRRHVRERRNYRISISQKDRRLLDWIVSCLGLETGVYIQGSRRKSAVHVLRISQQRLINDFLRAVFPWLIVKRERAIEALRTFETEYGWEWIS